MVEGGLGALLGKVQGGSGKSLGRIQRGGRVWFTSGPGRMREAAQIVWLRLVQGRRCRG